MVPFELKGKLTLKSKIYLFPLTCNAIYPYTLFKLQSFGDIGPKAVCFLLNIIELNITRLVVLKATETIQSVKTQQQVSRNHDTVTWDNPQIALQPISPKLLNSHQSRWINSTTGKKKNTVILEWTVSLITKTYKGDSFFVPQSFLQYCLLQPHSMMKNWQRC